MRLLFRALHDETLLAPCTTMYSCRRRAVTPADALPLLAARPPSSRRASGTALPSLSASASTAAAPWPSGRRRTTRSTVVSSVRPSSSPAASPPSRRSPTRTSPSSALPSAPPSASTLPSRSVRPCSLRPWRRPPKFDLLKLTRLLLQTVSPPSLAPSSPPRRSSPRRRPTRSPRSSMSTSPVRFSLSSSFGRRRSGPR